MLVSNVNQENNTTQKRSKLKISKKHIQGFIAGVLLMSIVMSVYFIGNPDILLGTMANPTYVTDKDFDQVVLKSKNPVIVHFFLSGTPADPNEVYIEDFVDVHSGHIKYVKYNINGGSLASSKYYIMTNPTYCIFFNGEIYARMSGRLSGKQGDFADWVYNSSVPLNLTEEIGVPQNHATFYSMYPDNTRLGRVSGSMSEDSLSEIVIFPYKFTPARYKKCDGATIPINESFALYSLIGGDVTSIMLPNLTNISPYYDISYYICTGGEYPGEEYSPSQNINGIKYYAHDFALPDLYLGQIILADASAGTEYQNYLIPCDGRALNRADYDALFSLIGEGNDNYFWIPNLKNNSPIEGAVYYIVYNGIYPYR